jgi:hypothetical protein
VTTVEVQTSLGVVPVTGLPQAFTGDKLVVLVITGAFAGPLEMSGAPTAFAPDFDAFVVHLPGYNTPALSEVSVEAFARAFDEVLAGFGRPAVAYGVSVGGLVALAMKSPLIRRKIVVDPPMWTHKLWPLLPGLREQYWPEHRTFLETIFGMQDKGGVSRRYYRLIDTLSVPADVVVAEEPLYPVREVPRLPSLVDDEDRAFMAKYPLVTLHVAPGAGHNVPHHAGLFLHDLAMRSCRAAADARVDDSPPAEQSPGD